MPTTYNGVGTHYYGSKHKKSRSAVCQSCGHKAELTSYETRLWVVFLFIPMIPFGRKRILDQCSVCARHYAMPVKQWEIGRQTDTAAAMERFRKEQSEESAIEVHGQLVGYLQIDEAKDFRNSMLEKFSGRALLRAGFAVQLEFKGLPELAGKLWDEAFELDSQLPEVRVGIARRRMREEKLDEAREMLSFLEEPGAEQQYSLDPLFDLAGHYQHEKSHYKVLEIFEILLKAYPDISKDHQIRKFIRTSEKALRRKESILPDVKHSVTRLFSAQYSSRTRWVVGIAVALAIAAVGMVINNEYIRRHRELTVINDTGIPAKVQIDNEPSVSVTGMQKLSIAEGTHTIKVSGPLDEEHTIKLESDFWHRWTKDPVWIFNVGGEAIVADMIIHYSIHPREPTVSLLTEPFISRSDVDYAFEEPPDSMQVSSKSAVRNVSAMTWFELGNVEGGDVGGYYALKDKNFEQAYSYVERKLRRAPDSETLLNVLAYETKPPMHQRFRELLESRLDYRPLVVDWHRAYQDIPSVSANYDAVVQIYSDMLNRDPNNAVLLYLRGRIEKDPLVSGSFMDRAVQADPKVGQIWYSQAYRASSAEDWTAVLQLLDKAAESGMAESEVIALRHTAMLALKRYEELQQLLQIQLNKSPSSVSVATLMAEVLVIQEKGWEAGEVMNKASEQFKSEMNGRFQETRLTANAMLAYYQGDLTKSLEISNGVTEFDPIRKLILIESDSIDTVANEFQFTEQREHMWLPLIISLGYYQNGKPQNVERWYQKQIQQLRQLGPRYEFLTSILSQDVPTVELIEKVRLVADSPTTSAIIFTCLGLRAKSDDVRRAFTNAAKNVTIRRQPPYGLLKKIHDAMEPSR